jgi:hypothetical protein
LLSAISYPPNQIKKNGGFVASGLFSPWLQIRRYLFGLSTYAVVCRLYSFKSSRQQRNSCAYFRQIGEAQFPVTASRTTSSDNSSSNPLNETLTKKSKYIRYRESKLTYLLKDALGGNSKTVMICNVNPHIDAMKETRSTLQFA